MPFVTKKLRTRRHAKKPGKRRQKSSAITQARANIRFINNAIRVIDAHAISRVLKRSAICNLRVNDTALGYAILQPNGKSFSLLLEHEAYENQDSSTSVTHSIAQVFYDLADVRLRSHSSTVILKSAIGFNDLNGVKFLLKKNADVNSRTTIELSMTLHHAIRLVKVECVELLLHYGANPNFSHFSGQKPLDTAMRFCQPLLFGDCPSCINHSEEREHIIEMLLDAGANANITFSNCLEQLYRFDYNRIRSRIMEKVKLLLKHIVKMEPKLTHICSKNVELMMQHKCLKDFYMMCREEITKMLEVKIFGKVSLYDFMVKNTSMVSAFASNEHLTLVGDADKFPIYHKSLVRRINAAINRKKISKTASTAIRLIMRNRIDEGHIVTQKILQFLSMEDLKNLILICYPIEDDMN